jgi:hypothetical protein
MVLGSLRSSAPAAAAGVVIALLLGNPGPAVAATRDVPVDEPLAVVPAHLPDRVISSHGGAVRASAAGVVQAARTRSYRTTDGQSIEVAVSAAYPVDPVADQGYVDFLASRLHGSELGGLRLYVGRPAEVSRLCGGSDVVACYAPEQQRMYVPGEDRPGVPVGYAITHEYGHHIAASRRNDPWDTLDWGPKHWSSAVGVCAGVARHQLFVDDYDHHYLDNPGEGFADGYAHLQYPEQVWRYNDLMRPTAPVLDAIRRDVMQPWNGPSRRVLRGRKSGRMRLHLRLDGDVTVVLQSRPGSRFQLEARSDAWGVGRSLSNGGQLGIEWCRKAPGDSGMTLTVRRRAGSGPFRLTVRYAG